MLKIKNLVIDEFNLVQEIKNKKNVDFQRCLKVIDDIDLSDIIDLLPKKSKITVSFEITNTNVSLANAIRRCLIDEIETTSLDFDENKDLITTDPFILSDFIKKQVELLPITQEMDLTDLKIILKKENKTSEIIDVTSDDFVILESDSASKKKFKQKDLEKIVEGNIVLCRLRPNNTITINNIFISKGVAKQNAAKYNLLSNVGYKILDVDPIVETRMGQTGVSSMMSDPNHFFISYTTHRNIDYPKVVMIKCCDTLIKRLDTIHAEMKSISNTDITYTSPLIVLETINDLKKIQIIGEYWTLINIICQYCYKLTKKNIKFVVPALIHHEKEIGVIQIIHPEFSTLIKNSIKEIISDLKIVKSYFSD